MTTRGSRGMTADRRLDISGKPYRLDLLVNPYGASSRVQDALASQDDLHLPSPERMDALRVRVGAMHRLPGRSIVLAGGVDRLVTACCALAQDSVVVFPPADSSHAAIARACGRQVLEAPRSFRFAVETDGELPQGVGNALALVGSPNDPTGTVLSVPEAVRLARSVALLIIDERHAAYSPRTAIPLVGEFDNVIVLRTLETWAALTSFPLAYAVAPPSLAARLQGSLPGLSPVPAAVVAGLATLDDLRTVESSVWRVRDEKSHLFRTLRKLNMARPYPSWANFLLLGFERGDRAFFLERLKAEEIRVHVPEQEGLERFIRVSATTTEATLALKHSLIAAAAHL